MLLVVFHLAAYTTPGSTHSTYVVKRQQSKQVKCPLLGTSRSLLVFNVLLVRTQTNKFGQFVPCHI